MSQSIESSTGFPLRPEDVDTAWLTGVLRRGGVLPEGEVVAITTERVGNGLLGRCARLRLRYDAEPHGAPATLVAKFAAADPSARALCRANELYLREVRFYQEIAPVCGIGTARAFAALIDEATHDFVLLLEDQAPARSVDQLDGCSEADCATALDEIALLHALRFADPAIDRLPWLAGVAGRLPAQAAWLQASVRPFLERFGPLLDASVPPLLERFAALYGRIVSDRASPWMLQHGDFRLDNVLFDAQGRTGSMATVDWQTVAAGCGLFDVAFFVGGALETESRRRHERDLVRHYHTALCRAGVRGYGEDACWRDYRKYALRALFTPISAGLSVAPSARGDAMFARMTRLAASQALDLESLALWR